jgi:hypothetical protein
MVQKHKNMYIDKREMYTAIVKHKTACEDAVAAEKQKPRVPEYLGGCFMMLAHGIGTKRNFAGYPFIEDMKMAAVENCLVALPSFDPDKSKNAYGYFTKVVWWAFLRYIEKEKKNLYTKHKVTEDFMLHNPDVVNQDPGTPEDKARRSLENNYMADLARKYEEKDAEGRLKRANKKAEQRRAKAEGEEEFEVEVETKRRARQ